jgi:phosphopentomutase
LTESRRLFLIVLDGVGAGELPDARAYGDEGSSTLTNLARSVGGLRLPNLGELGLGNIVSIDGVSPRPDARAGFGKCIERSAGKDSTTGHWEIAGIITEKPFPVYPRGFPEKIVEQFVRLTGCGGVLGNVPASGTEIIARLGAEHMKTGYPILYTSADPVFQLAAHEQTIPLERLYAWCEIARHRIMVGDHAVSRVIARPFIGSPGQFIRTANRKDFSMEPPGPTILDFLTGAGVPTVSIGKVDYLFAGRGIGKKLHTRNNTEGISVLLDQLETLESGFVFINLVDFDQEYGHRNDAIGFGSALTDFDSVIPRILSLLREKDLLIITSDHGNDPTTPSTDHSREYAPLLAFRPDMPGGVNLGIRESFSDIAQTVADHFDLNEIAKGKLKGQGFYHLM